MNKNKYLLKRLSIVYLLVILGIFTSAGLMCTDFVHHGQGNTDPASKMLIHSFTMDADCIRNCCGPICNLETSSSIPSIAITVNDFFPIPEFITAYRYPEAFTPSIYSPAVSFRTPPDKTFLVALNPVLRV